MPANLGEVLEQFETVLVVEMNLGQLLHVLRDRYLIDAIGYQKIQGKPLMVADVYKAIKNVLAEGKS